MFPKVSVPVEELIFCIDYVINLINFKSITLIYICDSLLTASTEDKIDIQAIKEKVKKAKTKKLGAPPANPNSSSVKDTKTKKKKVKS